VATPGPLEDRLLRLNVPGSGSQLGLELAGPDDAAAAGARLPAATLRHLVAALAAATRRAADEAELALLQAREREQERFVSMVVHELRTPLTGLGGYLDLLAAGAVDDPEIGREFIERGRGIVERMAALVGDLLELSRLEAGSLRLEIERVSLAEACERAMDALAPIAAGRGIRLAADLPPRLRTARADRRRVEQIVTNLGGNACKFVPDGGLVEIAARLDDDVALVLVRDDGPGIERADRERVFRRFARLEGHDRVPGTGLGLPISRDLARAMGGEIAVASVPGSGTTFVLGLPAAPDVGRGAVAAAVAAAVAVEEATLEERAILAAIRAGGRDRETSGAPGTTADRGGATAPRNGPPRVDAA
jgi:signal transduction histidine kinase